MLGALYVAAVGFGMVYVGIAFTANFNLGDFDALYKKIFSGGLIACFFWVNNNNSNNNIYIYIRIHYYFFTVLLIFLAQECPGFSCILSYILAL